MSLARVKLSLGQPHRTLVVLEHFLQEVTWKDERTCPQRGESMQARRHFELVWGAVVLPLMGACVGRQAHLCCGGW